MQKISNRPFFVYGTLLPGQPNDFLWEDAVVSHSEAYLANGRLYDLGHYPMLIEEGESFVQGMVMAVKAAAYTAVLARLDHLEGYEPTRPQACAYQRVERDVRLVDGRVVAAWVYIGQPHYVAGCAPLDEQNWAAYVATVAKQSRDWWADIDTVSGLLD